MYELLNSFVAFNVQSQFFPDRKSRCPPNCARMWAEFSETKSLSPIDPNYHVELFMAQQCLPDVFHSHAINVRLYTGQRRSILDF